MTGPEQEDGGGVKLGLNSPESQLYRLFYITYESSSALPANHVVIKSRNRVIKDLARKQEWL